MHIDHNLTTPSQHLYTAVMCTSTAISPHQANICTLLYSAHRPQSHHTKPTSVYCCNVHIDHNLTTPSQHLYTAVMCTSTTISQHQANICTLLQCAHRPQTHNTKPTSVHCCNVHIDHNLIAPSQHLYTAAMCTLTTIS